MESGAHNHSLDNQRQEQRLEALLLKKGVFPVHAKARLSSIEKPPKIRPSFIWGKVGCGKTYLAVAYLAEELKNCLHSEYLVAGSRFVRAVDLITQLRSSFQTRSSPYPQEIVDYFQRYRFLVLDDLGTERDTPLVQESLYSIIDYRAGHLAPTLITSNLSLDQIAGQYGDYGERFASRIAGMGMILEMKGKDRRWQK